MTATGVWAGVVGQPEALERLQRAAVDPVHAYLFVGPPGCGKEQAARAFAAALICADGGCGTCRDCTLALAGRHPDVHEIVRVGASISAEQAEEIVRGAALSPVEGDRKVMVLHEFHLVAPPAAARLLKTIEEPPARTLFVVLADQQTPELVTIASRCVRVPFRPLDEATIRDALMGEGVTADEATTAARAAAGDLDRARILAADPNLRRRREAFASVPTRLDGTGARVLDLVDELLGLIEDAAQPLKDRQQAEAEALDERAKIFGERGSGRRSLEERHKRELRRHRADELRYGLAAIAGVYRDALVAGHARPEQMADASRRVHRAIEAVERNPNEPLLLQALLLDLPAL